jgi:hypothetical protein
MCDFVCYREHSRHPANRGLVVAHTICSGAKFDLDQVDAHTLGPRLVHRALDFAFTGNR